jgi:type IX secretion system PorP/SprF family membrane protein
MKFQRIGLAIAFLSAFLQAFGQQDPQVTQNMLNYGAVNPGFYGMSEGICATGLVRQQNVGLKDMAGTAVNPRSFFLNVDAPVRILGGGLGASVYQDEIGVTRTVGVEVGYSYHKRIGFGNLGMGFNIGFLNPVIDFGKLNPIDEADPVLENRQGEEQDIMLNFSLGAFYEVESDFYVGGAVSRISQNQGPNTRYSNKRHYYLMAGYHYPLSVKHDMVPSVFVTFTGTTTQINLTNVVYFEDKYWAGVNYRYQDAVSLMAGLVWKDFKFGYSYDLTTSKLGGAGTSGTHEISLGYCFKLEFDKDNVRYRNTRFL